MKKAFPVLIIIAEIGFMTSAHASHLKHGDVCVVPVASHRPRLQDLHSFPAQSDIALTKLSCIKPIPRSFELKATLIMEPEVVTIEKEENAIVDYQPLSVETTAKKALTLFQSPYK